MKALTLFSVLLLFMALATPIGEGGNKPTTFSSNVENQVGNSSPINVSEDLLYPPVEYFFEGSDQDLSRDILDCLDLSPDLGGW